MYKNKNFDYDLWTTNDDGTKRYWVRIRATQKVTEVDLATIRFLRNEEKKIFRKTETTDQNAPIDAFTDSKIGIFYPMSLDFDNDNNDGDTAWTTTTIDVATLIIEKEQMESFVSSLTEYQQKVFKAIFQQGESQTDFAKQHNVSARSVRYVIDSIRKKAKEFFV